MGGENNLISLQEALDLVKRNFYKDKNYDSALIDLENAEAQFTYVVDIDTSVKYNKDQMTKFEIPEEAEAEEEDTTIEDRTIEYRTIEERESIAVAQGVAAVAGSIQPIQGLTKQQHNIGFKRNLYNGGIYTFKGFNEDNKLNGTVDYKQPLWKNYKVNTLLSNVEKQQIEVNSASIDDMILTQQELDKTAIIYISLDYSYKVYNALNELLIIENINENIDRPIIINLLNDVDETLLEGIFILLFSIFKNKNTLREHMEKIKEKIENNSDKLKDLIDDRSILPITTVPLSDDIINVDLNVAINYALENNFELKKIKNDIVKLNIDLKSTQNKSLPDVNLEINLILRPFADPTAEAAAEAAAEGRFNNFILNVLYDGKKKIANQTLEKKILNQKSNRENDLKLMEKTIIKKIRNNEKFLKLIKRQIERYKNIHFYVSSQASLETFLEKIILIINLEILKLSNLYQQHLILFKASLKYNNDPLMNLFDGNFKSEGGDIFSGSGSGI